MNWNYEQAFKRLVARPIICVKLYGQHKHHILLMCFTIHSKEIVSVFFSSNGIKRIVSHWTRITEILFTGSCYRHLFQCSTLWSVCFFLCVQKTPTTKAGPKRNHDKAMRNDLFVNLFLPLNWANNLIFCLLNRNWYKTTTCTSLFSYR